MGGAEDVFATPPDAAPVVERVSVRLLRRALDLLVSAAVLILMLPLLLFVALLITLDSPGPVLFAQVRCGRGDRPFKVLKFRTMAIDAERRLAELLSRDPRARAEYESHHKLTRDPRITRIGRFLRRTSLDEVPQFLNVLKGEMSLIGPRPYLPAERADIGAALPAILSVRPGLTGLWQITERNNATFAQRVAIDCAYVRQRSLRTDVRILLATLPAVLRAHGAH